MAFSGVDNRKVTGGILVTPGVNTNSWYCKEPNGQFSVHGAFNGMESLFDWVIVRSSGSQYIKAGVWKNPAEKSSIRIPMQPGFKNDNYFLFYSTNSNVNMFTCEKKKNSFVVASSSNLGTEISWLAIHKDFARKAGVKNPGSIYAGSRVIGAFTETNTTCPSGRYLDLGINGDENGETWCDCEYIIKPTKSLDGIVVPMDIEEYSVILSSNININMFWLEKSTDRVKIGTSFPDSGIIDYLIVKKGIDWWEEF